MTTSTQGTRTPRPSSTAAHQCSSPRLPSPLNPAPSLHTPRTSPISEMSDTLSPLRERLDSGLTISPLISSSVARPRSSSFSHTPERSPIMGTVLLQPHVTYMHRACPGGSLFASGIPFPSSSPGSPSPFAGPSLSTAPQNQRSLSPSNSPRLGSPTSAYSVRHPVPRVHAADLHASGTHSHFQTCPLRSPTQPASTHGQLYPGSPIQIVSSPSRYHRTQSLIQQSFGSPYPAQGAASLADSVRNRRVSLGAEVLAHQSMQGGPIIVGQPPLQGTPATVKGDSTPLDEAPVRWWGGRSGWVDDWEILAQQSNGTYDMYNGPSDGQFDGRAGMGFVPEYGSPPTYRRPFGRGGDSPSAFQDEEIRASFVGTGSIDKGFAEPLTPGLIYAPIGIDATYRMDGIPVHVPQAVPVPTGPGGGKSRMQKDGLGYGEVEVGPPVDNGFAMQRVSDDPSRCHSCHPHPHGNADGGSPNGASFRGHMEPGGRNRRLSDASTRSSTSYASCLSGPSHSQSQLLLVSSSQSHTSTCPSLSSLGIGIEEAEREELRSRSIWRRKNVAGTVKRLKKALNNDTNECNEEVVQGCRRSRLLHVDDPETGDAKAGEVVELTGLNSKNLTMQARDKGDNAKHGSVFSRAGSKHGDVPNEHAQREGYNMAEKYVSLAITSILPVATITNLSPFGEALIKARNSAKYVGHELAPLLKDTLSVSTEILSLAPLPGLEEAAKALLCVWDACQKVDTNRLSCLRLAERCATLLYSVRCEISEAGVDTAVGLAEPVEKLCGALVQIRTFLETQLHRPFLKRYVKREEIARELQACNEAITDAGSRFGISVQIRTYQEVCTAMKESRRWIAQEAQALIQLDHQMMQRHSAMMYGSQVQTWQEVGFSSGNALGLSMDGELVSTNGRGEALAEECEYERGGRLSPPPAYGPPPSLMSTLQPTELGTISGRTTPTSSILSVGFPSAGADSTAPVTPTPTRATFVMKETATPSHPTCPMQALAHVHRAQDAVDAAADEAALRGTLVGALNTQNDLEMVRCLQVARGEIPEAAETLRRMLGTDAEAGEGGNEHASSRSREPDMEIGQTELDRKFMKSGIEAMTRLTSVVAKQPEDAGANVELEGTVVSAPGLPSWTITRYEVIRRRKIGMGFFSDVYLGHWRKLDVVIKVLAHSVSREAFLRHIELWNSLDHPNVLPLYGASSAIGEKPWFFVSKFCGGGNLMAWLQRMKLEGTTTGNEPRVDLLKSMYQIANGMAYLHGCGVLHGDLRAANVLVDENGQCIVSDFSQSEIKWEAHQSCGQAAPRPIRWRAPEMLTDAGQPTCATDVYAFAMCCIEILCMGDIPWKTLDDKTISELVLDKDERPPIPVLAGPAETADAVKNLVHSCWDRKPDRRPTSAGVAVLLEELLRDQDCGSPGVCRTSTPVVDIRPVPATPTESSPGEEQYETASESMMTEVEDEHIDCMVDVPLASPRPVLGHADVCSVVHIVPNDHIEVLKIPTQTPADVPERQDIATPMPSLTNALDIDTKHEETYRHIVGSNHSFHSSLTLPLWSPTPVELGAVGYLSKPKGEFITLFNAMDPLRSGEQQLRRLPSMYGYGKFEMQKREDGKRSVAQRGFDAISGFLTFKTRSDRSHPERIARQYAFPLVQGKPFAGLCAEKTVHRYIDRLEAPKTWFEQHADAILEALAPLHTIKKEDLILVVGTLDASDWAIFVSDDHSDGRVQFSVFSGREKGEPWGIYTMEQAIKGATNGPTRWVDVSHTISASKMSCVTPGGHDAAGDTVMLAGIRFEQGMHIPT